MDEEAVPPLPPATGRVYRDQEGDELIEVETDDIPPDSDDDASTIWGTEMGDGDDQSAFDEGEEAAMAMAMAGPVADMSRSAYQGHGDSHVYCAAIHPSYPGVVITGGGDDRGHIWAYDTRKADRDSSEAEAAEAPEATGMGLGLGVVSALVLEGHTDTVSCVGFNFDGTLALTGSTASTSTGGQSPISPSLLDPLFVSQGATTARAVSGT